MDWDGTLQAFEVPVGTAEPSFGLGIGFQRRRTAREEAIQRTRGRRGCQTTSWRCWRRAFGRGIKLDIDRKIRLSRELGLDPRQVAVWFQNRRARWKAKQMEVLYTELRQEFDVACKEKLKLQEEALRLKSMRRFRAAGKKQLALGSPRQTYWREQLTYANSQLHE